MMKLNTEKIEKELERIKKSRYQLAREIGRSPQLILYWLDAKSLRGAEPIGKALGISPRDLII